MTTHLCYTQDRVHTPYDYIIYRFLHQLAWIAKFSLCSPSALLHLPSYIFPLPSYIFPLTSSAIIPQTSDFLHRSETFARPLCTLNLLVSQIYNPCFFDSVYIGTKVFWNKDLSYQPYSSLALECSTEQPRSRVIAG